MEKNQQCSAPAIICYLFPRNFHIQFKLRIKKRKTISQLFATQ